MRWKILILIVVLMVPTCMYTLKNTERNTYYLGPRSIGGNGLTRSAEPIV